MARINKPALIEAIAAKAGITKAQAESALDAITATISESTQAGHSVALHGFGTFSMRQRAARPGRNPHTGAPIDLPASQSLGFKASKSKAGA